MNVSHIPRLSSPFTHSFLTNNGYMGLRGELLQWALIGADGMHTDERPVWTVNKKTPTPRRSARQGGKGVKDDKRLCHSGAICGTFFSFALPEGDQQLRAQR
ncbi:hypothetical protein HPB48_001251 [Haemaphysalis longicornis]|uniref:Uncharacterized protein n=1 Tax=Haemaphysalis longicornis TaxID=44386 RepID=A0A9J6FKY6_HAELO|nr:hypothetical protein HPB48_001251 [Haemaphysalis longicornis]